MKKNVLLVIFIVVVAASVLSGCSSNKDKNTTVNVNDDTVMDVDD